MPDRQMPKRDWEYLSLVMPMGDIKDHPHLPWDMDIIANRSDIQVDTLLALQEAGKEIPWYKVSIFIPIQQVRKHPHLPWDKGGLSRSKGITLDDVQYLELPNATRDYSWEDLSSNIPIPVILDNPHIPWRIEGIASNKGLTMDMASKMGLLIAYPPDYGIWIDMSATLPIQEILDNPTYPWRIMGISRNPSITTDIAKHMGLLGNIPHSDCDYKSLSTLLPVKDILGHPNLPWSPDIVSRRATTKEILDNPSFSWRMGNVILYNKEVDINRLLDAGILTGWENKIHIMTNPIDDIL